MPLCSSISAENGSSVMVGRMFLQARLGRAQFCFRETVFGEPVPVEFSNDVAKEIDQDKGCSNGGGQNCHHGDARYSKEVGWGFSFAESGVVLLFAGGGPQISTLREFL